MIEAASEWAGDWPQIAVQWKLLSLQHPIKYRNTQPKDSTHGK